MVDPAVVMDDGQNIGLLCHLAKMQILLMIQCIIL